MTTRNAGTVAIKLDMRGQEDLRRRMAALGAEGDRMFRDMMRAARPVQAEMGLVGQSIMVVKDEMDGMVRAAGPFGQVFQRMGVWGYGAVAVMGLVALAIREVLELMETSRETAFWAEQLENVSDAAGIAEERIVSLASAVQLAGGNFDGVLGNLEEFSKRIGEYRNTGQGEARDAFAALGLQELVENGADATTILDAVIERIRQIDDPARRQSIADKLGLAEAAPLLQQTGDEMERILDAADGINRALSSEVLERFASAGEAIREAQMRQERARQLQSLATLDMEVARNEAVAMYEERRAALLQAEIPVRQRSAEAMESQLEVARRLIENSESRLENDRLEVRERSAIEQVLRQQLRIEQEITGEFERRAQMAFDVPGQMAASSMSILEAMQTRWNSGQGNSVITTERMNELTSLVEARLNGLLTPLQRVEQLESDLNEAREAGIDISLAQIETIVAQERAAQGLAGKLAELTDEERKLMGAADQANDPLQEQKELLESLREEIVTSHETAEDRLTALYELWGEAGEHADLFAAAIERAKAALGESDTDSEIRMEDRFGGLRKMADDMADVDAQLDRFGTDTVRGLTDELDDVIDRSQSVGEAFENMGDRIIRAWIRMQTEMLVIAPAASALDGLLNGVFGTLFSGVTGGSKGGSMKLPGHDWGGSYIIGGQPGIDANTLSMNGRPFARVSQGEEFQITPRNGRSAMPEVNVTINNAPAGAQVKRSRNSQGGLDLEILFDQVKQVAAQTAAGVTGDMLTDSGGLAAEQITQHQLLKG